MTKDRIIEFVAVILTTLVDVGGWSPASSIYLLMGSNIHDYEAIVGLLVSSGLVTRTSEVVTITDKGRKLAAECAAIVQEAR